jgi:hypothetical protein
VSKTIRRIIPVAFILLFGGVRLAHAQNASVYFGVGTATDSSNNQSLDGSSEVGPSMGGAFIKFGGDVMFRPTLGFGAEYSGRAAQDTYAPNEGLNYRPIFYDFNAVWHPIAHGRIMPEFQGGLGGADLKFYETETGCITTNVCQTLNQYIASSNHFQLHFSGGVRFYVNSIIYVQPQIDAHWVRNFQEFGSDWAPQYGATVGFTFGGR